MNATPTIRLVRPAIAVLLAAALLAMLVATGCTTKIVAAPEGTTANSVIASGSGKVAATPDEATMFFGVSAQAPKADDALAAASKTAEAITKAVVAEGVDKEDIQTTGVNVYPRSDQSGKVTGYEANLSVSVKVKDLGTIGEVIAAANAAGANNISGPSFGISDDAEYRAQAIEKAVDDARASAEAMAKAAGGTLGDVISITSSNVMVPQPMAGATYDSAKAASLESVPVEPGQLDVTADLTVVFELR